MNEQLIKFIELCLTDGVITDKEREVIYRKAAEFGVDIDECEVILESMIQKKNLELKSSNPNNVNVSDINIPLIETDSDNLFRKAAEIFVEAQSASASLLQRKLKLDYDTANELIDELENVGIISAFNGSSPRSVYIQNLQSLEQFFNNRQNVDRKYIKLNESKEDLVDEEFEEIEMNIAKIEEEAQETPKTTYKLETFEEYNQKLEEEEEEENERRRIQLLEEAQEMPKVAYKLETFEEYNQKLEEEEEEEEDEKERRRKQLLEEAIQRMAEQDEENEKELNEKQDLANQKIGSHEFKSSITRGGDALFPEHIYVDDNEVTWKKKTGVFSKDTKTISIKNVTQIDIETSLIGAKIKILTKGHGFIQGENFTKSDVKEIKNLIEKVQRNY
jgi:hypothetical protein